MKSAKKAVRKFAVARKKAKDSKVAREARKKAQSAKDSAADEKNVERAASELMRTGCAHMNERPSGVVEVSRVPPRLFKYAPCNLAHVRNVLMDNEIWFASPLTFNDPADCSVVQDYSGNKIFESIGKDKDAYSLLTGKYPDGPQTEVQLDACLGKMAVDGSFERGMTHEVSRKRAEKSNLGVVCFCERHDDPRMWAHYADNNKGVCYVFDFSALGQAKSAEELFPFGVPEKVTYCQEKPLIEPGDDEDRFLKKTILTKSAVWKAEREWRSIMPDAHAPMIAGRENPYADEPNFCGGGRKYSMRSKQVIGVILGCFMNEGNRKKVKSMANSRGMAVWRATPKVQEYGLNCEPANKQAKKEELPRTSRE